MPWCHVAPKNHFIDPIRGFRQYGEAELRAAPRTFIIITRVLIEFYKRCIRIKRFAQKSSLASAVRKGNFARAGGLALPLLVLALAVFVYGLYGFDGVLLRDYSIYLYSGQMIAEGVPPYVSAFDHKGPLSPMLAGLGVVLSGLLGWDDVYTVRLVFFTTACLGVVAVYLLGTCVFRSRVAGLFGALTLEIGRAHV
jgi:hypothetical protein